MVDDVSRILSETMTRLGIDVSNPMEAQRDFMYLRSLRQTTEAVKRHSMLAVIGVITAGVLGVIWQAIKGAV